MKPHILILSFSKIQSDPRVMRQARLLQDVAELTIVGYGGKPDIVCEFKALHRHSVRLIKKLWWVIYLILGQFELYYWQRPEVVSAAEKLDGNIFDLIICNDSASLPLALRIAKDKPVLLDAHEYSPREFDEKFIWRFLFGRYHDYICKKYLPLVTAMTTVCRGIADAYHINFGVCPKVVLNAPDYEELAPSTVAANKIRLVHHGAAIRSRNLEAMIDIMRYLDYRFSLDLMLVESDVDYMRELRSRAAHDTRIQFVPPVQMENICTFINGYDVGIYLLAPVNFNQEFALPNKLFEFIQGRLAIAIGPSPEMVRIVEEYEVGIISKSFKPIDFALELLKLSEVRIKNYKEASHKAARELNFEKSGRILLQQIHEIINQSKVAV